MQYVSSISGLPISAGSAAYAPTNGADVSAIASAYQVVSAVGDDGTYITSINGSGISGAGGGGAQVVTSTATGEVLHYKKSNPTIVETSTALSSVNGYGIVASTLIPGAYQSKTGSYQLEFSPTASMFGVPSGVFSPLQYATGAGVVMSAGNFRGYVKGNEFYVSDRYGYVRGESHITRGNRVVVQSTGSASAQIYAYGSNTAQLRLGTTAGSAKIDTADINMWNSAASSLSGKLDSTAFSTVSGNFLTAQTVTALGDDGTYITSINGSALSGVGGGGGGGGNYVETSAMEVAIGSATAQDTAFAQGVDVSASSFSLAQGYQIFSNSLSIAQGIRVSAYFNSLAQGDQVSASATSLAQGNWARAILGSLAQGYGTRASSNSLAQGYQVSASATSLAQGFQTIASAGSFAQGSSAQASNYSFAQGDGVSASATAAAFGCYNLKGNGASTGDNVAFVIGDGTGSGDRHDLINIYKDGEITTYSATSDTTGLPIVATLRSIMSWASANGWTGI